MNHTNHNSYKCEQKFGQCLAQFFKLTLNFDQFLKK